MKKLIPREDFINYMKFLVLGQAGAVRLGVSRALEKINSELFKKPLRDGEIFFFFIIYFPCNIT